VAQKNLSCCDVRELRKLVDHDHPRLRVRRQCALLGLPRSALSSRPTPVRESMMRIMGRIDALYLKDLCSAGRRMAEYLAREGIPVSRDQVLKLMKRIGLLAIYQKPRINVRGNPSERLPCLVNLKQVDVPPLSVQALWELVDVVMLQFPVELPPGAYAPGGPSVAWLSCTPSSNDRPGVAPPGLW